MSNIYTNTEAKIKKIFNYGDQEVIIETGELACQASSAVFVTIKDTVVFISCVVGKNINSNDFLALTVNYQIPSYAKGKIPNNYFRREGRPLEQEILIARLIDRSLRPLFPKNFRHDIQMICKVLCLDDEVPADIPSLIGASAAITLAGLPCNDPIAAARVGLLNKQYVLNLNETQLKNSELDLVVSGNKDSIIMVEAEAAEVSEQELLGAMTFAHENMQVAIKAIEELRDECNTVSFNTITQAETTLEADLQNKILSFIEQDLIAAYANKNKKIRNAAIQDVKNKLSEKLENDNDSNIDWKILEIAIQNFILNWEKNFIRNRIINENMRLDGRNTQEIRPITINISPLPNKIHGSATFMRGDTKVLAMTTLGSERDAQSIPDSEQKKSFMLHYNFPPYCTGDIKHFLSTSRREIGHGNLAERSFKHLLPKHQDFAYTIRVVNEVMDSNGSSSMATVCASCLSLMDAGVPISKHVAGIAMGLIKENEKFAILSDILGDEDHFGDMDFKVVGTKKGITALQMDIKISGINQAVMSSALEQAKEGRLHILNIMEQNMPGSRLELSPQAPRIVTMKIPVNKIKDLIGKGGANIKNLCKDTGVTADIDESGVVKIYSSNAENLLNAKKRIKELTSDLEIGQVFTGTIDKIVEFGMFITLTQGKSGLLHISKIKNIRNFNVGNQIKVKILDIDYQGRIKLISIDRRDTNIHYNI